jgi:alcohol dehydrogenase class IV
MDFAFYLPTRIVFGWGASSKVDEELSKLGSKKVLVVTDSFLAKSSLLSSLLSKLEGVQYDVYDRVAPEPSIEVAEDVAEIARKGGYDTVIGYGGGSSIDMAKIASLASRNTGRIESYVGNNLFKNKGIHSVMIPTTSGTGAELTVTSMVTISGHKQWINSPLLMPELAIVDPELTISMPPKVTASTGLDALCHNTESIFSTLSNHITESVALRGISLIARSIERAYADGNDRVARANMSIGATLGGIALQARMVYGHSIGYTVATRYNLPHGISCGIPLPYIISNYSRACAGKMHELALAFGVENSDDPVKTGTIIAERVVEILRRINVPTSFKEIGVDRASLRELAHECLELYHRPNSTLVLDLEAMVDLYERIWEGNVQPK